MTEPEDMSRFVQAGRIDLLADALTKLFMNGSEITVSGTYNDTAKLCDCEGCKALGCGCLAVACCVMHRMAMRDRSRRWVRAHRN